MSPESAFYRVPSAAGAKTSRVPSPAESWSHTCPCPCVEALVTVQQRAYDLPHSLARSLTQSLLRLLSRPPKVSRLLLRCHTPNYSFSRSLFPLPLLWIEPSPPPHWVQHGFVLMSASGCGYQGWEPVYISADIFPLLLCFLTVQRLRTHLRVSSRYPSFPLLAYISKAHSSHTVCAIRLLHHFLFYSHASSFHNHWITFLSTIVAHLLLCKFTQSR